MSTFSYDIDTQQGDIKFEGVFSLREVLDWGEDASTAFNVFMKAADKHSISTRLGALSMLFFELESQEGTEVKQAYPDQELN